MMEARISIITLGVAEMDRAIRFYRDGLGWHTPSKEGDDWAIFRTAGTRLSLYPRDKLAEDIGPDVSPGDWTFGGITLAHNARTKEHVDAILVQAERAGGRILKPAQDADWGGYSGYFADLDGYPWEVAWSTNNRFDEQGTLWGGPLGEPPASA